MSIECEECERDLRAGHAEACSRKKGADTIGAIFDLLEPLGYGERQHVIRTIVAYYPRVPSAEAPPTRGSVPGDDEAEIVINGHLLTLAQSLAVRMAISGMLRRFSDPDALGKDEHGRAMTRGYRRLAGEVQELIFKNLRSGS